MQARKTAEALSSMGAAVEHILYRNETEPSESTSVPLSTVPTSYDVWHFLPGRPVPRDLLAMRKRRKLPLLACSPVYWDSLPHRSVIWNNTKPGFRASPLSYSLQNLLRAAIKRPLKALPYDVYFPNSQAEIAVLLRDYRLPRHALVAAVPNAADPAPDIKHEVSDQKCQYLLYPGVFAPPKNQLGFIEALRTFSHPVVFLGGPLPTPECQRYFAECKERAPAHWTFLGQVPHGSAAFYDALCGAKVACLASSCETPGISLIEAAALGARPAVTREGSAVEYFGFEAEYFDSTDQNDLLMAVLRAWGRGRLCTNSAELLASSPGI